MTAKGLRGEDVVQGGCSGMSHFVQKYVDVVSHGQVPFVTPAHGAASSLCEAGHPSLICKMSGLEKGLVTSLGLN